jgi:hypothetical protein
VSIDLDSLMTWMETRLGKMEASYLVQLQGHEKADSDRAARLEERVSKLQELTGLRIESLERRTADDLKKLSLAVAEHTAKSCPDVVTHIRDCHQGMTQRFWVTLAASTAAIAGIIALLKVVLAHI